MTALTLSVATCENCPVQLNQAIEDGPYPWWTSDVRRIHDGVVRFTVPTGRTHGMTFLINPAWQNASNAVPVVVTRYQGTRAGQIISNQVARDIPVAAGCWAGTSAASAHLYIRAVKFPARTWIGDPGGYGLRVWFRPLVSSTEPMHRTWRGTFGVQDAYACRL